ncbi:MAG: ABC transporter permease [Gemmatimonadales bacterium]
MRRGCYALLERFLEPAWAETIIGDLEEACDRGSLWVLWQTLAALAQLQHRPPRGDGMFSTFVNDLRIGARQLRRSPAFAATAVVTLAGAIGAAAAMLSVIDPVLLHPLPYATPNRLMLISERNADGTSDGIGFQTIADVAAQSHVLEHWAAIGGWGPTIGDRDPEVATGARVSWSYFRTLGVSVALGRDFLPEEDQQSRNQVVILGHGLWQRRFGGDSLIVGKSIIINGGSMLVAGVMPASYDDVLNPGVEIWRVLGYDVSLPYACRTCRHLQMIGRLKAGVTSSAAHSDLDGVLLHLIHDYPKEYASVGALVTPMQQAVTASYRGELLALLGAVVLLLLIAASNVINLQLARAVRRRSEFAVRAALGAARFRLTRQLLAEGVLLALLGGAGGLLVGRVALPMLQRQLPPALPRVNAIHLDATAFGAVALVVLLLSVVMALVPGAHRQRNLGETLRSGGRLTGAMQHRTRSALVVLNVALATMLLGSAAMIGRSMLNLFRVDPGFAPDHLLTLNLSASGPRYGDAGSVLTYHRQVIEAVSRVPGVRSVALSNQVPLGGNYDTYSVVDADHPPANPELAPSGDRYVVSANYLGTLRTPLIRGRGFTEADAHDSAGRVVIVSASLAGKLWPGADPLGKHVRMGESTGPGRTVIGVVADVKHHGLDNDFNQQWYVPEGQWLFADNSDVVIVRTSVDPGSVARAVRTAIASLDPTVPISSVATMDHLIAVSTAQRRLALVLFGAFAGAALLLAMAGIYGVLAGTVAERTREIGVRSALGADAASIVRLVVIQGARLGAVGLVAGFLLGLALVRYLRAFLFNTGTADLGVTAVVVVVLGGATVLACLIPAWRAVRIEPTVALRGE